MQRTIEVRLETLITRPPDEVWAFVSDLEHLPDWLEEFRAVTKETPGLTGEGAVFRYTVAPGNRTGTLRLVEWIAGKRLAWDGPALGWRIGAARPRGYFEALDAGESQTRFISCYRPQLQGGMVLLAPAMKRWLRRQRRIDADRLKALLEATTPAKPAESAMSRENVEIVRQVLDAYSRRDIDAMRAVADPAIVLDWSASVGWLAGVYRGFDETERFYEGYFEAFEEVVIVADRYIEAGDSVVVPNTSHQRGRDGIEVSARATFVFTLRNRKITRICLYQETEEALEAVGLEE